MSYSQRGEELLEELDQHELLVDVPDETKSVPTLSCESDSHNKEPIREGEQAVFLLIRDTDGNWSVKHTFCSHCQVLDSYTEIDSEGEATAVVEGVVVPENEFGPSKQIQIIDSFLWEIYEEP